MKEKSLFIVGLLAVILALPQLKEVFDSIHVDVGFSIISIYDPLYYMLGFLLLSTYCYALQYINGGVFRLEAQLVYKRLTQAGDILYFIAVLMPIGVFLLWGVVGLYHIFGLTSFVPEAGVHLISIILLSGLLLYSIRLALRRIKERKEASTSALFSSAVDSASDTRILLEKGKWGLTILEAFRSLELHMQTKLLDLGFENARMPPLKAAEFLYEQKIISELDLVRIKHTRDVRNKAAHSSKTFSREDAEEVMKIVETIIPKIARKREVGWRFERKALEALTSTEIGFFPKDHLKLIQRPQEGFDAVADGPDYYYYILIKLGTTSATINNIFDQLLHHAKFPQNRYLLILPSDVDKIEPPRPNIRVLYYDLVNNAFTNREEIYQWIVDK